VASRSMRWTWRRSVGHSTTWKSGIGRGSRP